MKKKMTIGLLTCCVCSPMTIAATLEARCDGLGGYCSPGSTMTVRYISGDNVLIPHMVGKKTGWSLAYCLDFGGTTTDQNCPFQMAGDGSGLDNSYTTGNKAWGSMTGRFVGSFTVPNYPIAQGKYCITAYVVSHDGYSLGNFQYAGYGLNKISGNFSIPCTAEAPPPPPPDFCTVNSGDNLIVDFGSIERTEISVLSGIEKTKSITLACLGSKIHDFSVKLNMTPTSWSTSQLVTSNPDLGVQVTVGGTAVKLGSTFAMKVPGAASKTLGFSVLRNPASKALDIATGDFSASGTLVVSEL